MRYFRKRTICVTDSEKAGSKDTCDTNSIGLYTQKDNWDKIIKGKMQNVVVIDNNQCDTEKKPIKNGDLIEKCELEIEKNKYTIPKEPHWLLRRIYILQWIKNYDRDMAVSDLIAGITLGLTIIPQSIAYAALAGLSSEYGLYSAFIGSIIYVFFGTIPQVSIGPTSLMALLTLQFCADKPVQFVILLAFLAGLVELLMGVLQLGFIVNFISSPVTKAFTTATSIIIFLVQLKNLLGIKLKTITSVSAVWNTIKVGDATIGILCFTLLLALRQLSQIKFKEDTPATRRWKKILWYISNSRNALIVFSASLYTYVWVQKRSMEAVPYGLSSKVISGMPKFSLPPFVFEYNNATYVFTDVVSELGVGIIVVPIIAVLANVAIAKAFVTDGKLDASQEMLTLGLCNIAGSFFSAMPTCGAFTRSAVSQASGVRTPMAGIFTGTLVLLALSVLTPYFEYIPKSTLAAVLMAAVLFMIDFSPMKTLWKTNKKDFFNWAGCLIVCMAVGVEKGLYFGIIINIIIILLRLGHPRIEVQLREYDNHHYIHIVPHSDIYYTGVDALRTKVCSACVQYQYDFPVVIDCGRFIQFNSTFSETLQMLSKELSEKDTLLILQHVSPKLQQQMPALPNVRFCDEMNAGTFSMKLEVKT